MTRALICLIAAALLSAACTRAPKRSALPAGTVVLAIGNSVTFGTGADPGEDYPTRLAAITGWDIRNYGVPGDTAAGLSARIDDALAETAPKLVILEIGGNDFLRRHPESAVKDSIRAVLHRVRTAGIPTLLVSTPKFSPLGAAVGMLPDSPIYAELAKEEKVPLVSGVFAKVLADPALKSDPIHPNAMGYRKLADGIADELSRSGYLRTTHSSR